MFQTFLNPAVVCKIDGTEFYQYPNHERYLISKCGKVYDAHKATIIKQSATSRRYMSVHLYNDNGKYNRVPIHRLLALTFIANPANKPVVDHISGDKLDNSLTNLRWVTVSENAQNMRPRLASSQYIGVSWDSYNKRWKASIRTNGKPTHIGNYTDEKEAALAYNKRAAELGYLSRNITD